MIKYIITLCLSLLICPINAKSQEVTPSVELANFNYQIQNYRAAVKEYLRVYYFDRENKYPELNLRIANCFSHLKDSENAIKYYQYYLRQSDDNIDKRTNIFYALIRELISGGKYKLALAELFQLDNTIIEVDTDRYHYYLGMIQLLDADVESADQAFQELSYFTKIEMNDYQDALHDIQKNARKKHRNAKIWSAIVPGLGQAINGDVKDGINSLAINGSMVIIFFEVVKSLSTLDALISVAPWFGRFYTGGLKNAALASQKRQKQKANELTYQMIHIIEKAAVK